ncbi:hypothetical protein FRUB_00759 [Fimbriiglobus ruber]|uniref:Uncharacterized protein n=2 Tax=Fimbriiglobus ruber TaxID=1908690 RepID=A0A225DZX9_9BACT|nr:hypothetical protein FRUB_00759 [Fimbriiglobus ruber]
MEAFELHFAADGEVRGHGRDVVGRFTFHGTFDKSTGRTLLVKQYLGKHRVDYDGRPDGEGSILGMWTVRVQIGEQEWVNKGPFLMKPDVANLGENEPISEYRK